MKSFAACLRAARSLLALKRDKVDESVGFDPGTVGRLERAKNQFVPRHAFTLRLAYERKGILFEETTKEFSGGVRFREPGRDDPFRTHQFRAARAMLNLSQYELSDASGVDKSFIARLELNKSQKLSSDTATKLERFFESKGVEFVHDDGAVGAGVRLRVGVMED